MSVELSAADRFALERVIEKLGHVPNFDESNGMTIVLKNGMGTIYVRDGQAQFPTRLAPLVNEMKREYAKECVATVAKKLGWQKVNVGSNKIVLRKGV